MRLYNIFCIIIFTSIISDADELPEVTKKYYDNLFKEQQKLESYTLFKQEQLLFLNQARKNTPVIKKEELVKLKIKGMKLVDFIKLYGYPNKTYVPHNSRPMKGGECIWVYKNNLYLQLQLLNNEVIIRNLEFRKIDPRANHKSNDSANP